MNLTNNKRVIYKALSDLTIRVEFENPTDSEALLNCESSYTTYNSNDYMSPKAQTAWEIPLRSGESVSAWGNESITYKLYLDGLEVSYTISQEDILLHYKKELSHQVQLFLDNIAKQYWYDSMVEVPQFALVDNIWKPEAQILLNYNAIVWEIVGEHLNTENPQSIEPSDFILTLPTINI